VAPPQVTTPTAVPTLPDQPAASPAVYIQYIAESYGIAFPVVIPSVTLYPLTFFLMLEGPEQAETAATANAVEV